MSLPELLSAEAWDLVTIQQWSQLSYRVESFQPYADEIIAAIRKYAPSAEVLVHQTWAYREDHPFFQQGDGFTPARMYEGLSAAYRTFAASRGFRLIPVGDAFECARRTRRWSYVPDDTFNFEKPPAGGLPRQEGSLNVGWRWKSSADGELVFGLDAIHCNEAGKYLGAAVWYLAIFEADRIPGEFIPEALAQEDAADLRSHAYSAVRGGCALQAPPAR